MRMSGWSSDVCSSDLLDGRAVDLVPWVGKPVWEWDRIYPIAFAMDQAATELGLASKIRWGGAWDRVLSDFGGSIDSYREECEAYAKRHPGKACLDGPHFERSEERRVGTEGVSTCTSRGWPYP